MSDNLYKVGLIDAPGNLSKVSLYQNVIESSSILKPFENAYASILSTFNAFGYSIFDELDFENKIKPFYQYLRHGLSFDWIINYVCSKIHKTFPFFPLTKFKGTESFIESFLTDEVFIEEKIAIDKEYDSILNSLFSSMDKSVFTRLSADAESKDFSQCVIWARENNKVDDYFITEDLIYNMNYLVALGMMLEKSVGYVKRKVWHEALENIRNKESESILVCGGKFRSFAFGSIFGSEPKWHQFPMGIKYNLESNRFLDKNNPRVFPDEMTFFRFNPQSINIDETFFPEISFDKETWFDSNKFYDLTNLTLDKPTKIFIRYKFENKETRIIKLKSISNCVVKDKEMILVDGICENQIVFRSDSIQFQVSEESKEYPFAVFSNNKIKASEVSWL